MTDPPGPTDTGVLGPPPAGATPPSARPGAVRPHILVVNGRKVRQPVFVFGAPCSGVTILARALKRSEGFHFTMGQRWVLPVVHASASGVTPRSFFALTLAPAWMSRSVVAASPQWAAQ